jgi:hypothetical protein
MSSEAATLTGGTMQKAGRTANAIEEPRLFALRVPRSAALAVSGA